jgi:SAM-dependent methyltransferase
MHRKFFKTPHHLVESIGGFCQSRWGVPDFEKVSRDLADWLATPLGQALLKEEKEALNDALQNQFGYFLLQMGVAGSQSLTETSRISHRFTLHPQRLADESSSALADFHQLPLPNDSIDLVFLHHALEFSQNPHQLLREASRVLIPRGHLIIVVLNPWSIWGLFGQIARFFSKKVLWRHQYLSQSRLLDWLRLLEMEPVSVYRGYFRPPFPQTSLIEHLQWMERWGRRLCKMLHFPGGGFYMVIARKDQIPLTLIRPRWQKDRPLKSMVVTRSPHPDPLPEADRSNSLENS